MARHRPDDARTAAEAAFKKVTEKRPEPMPIKHGAPPPRETVSLRVDRDVLDYFQEDGPGWQDRMLDALRAAAKRPKA